MMSDVWVAVSKWKGEYSRGGQMLRGKLSPLSRDVESCLLNLEWWRLDRWEVARVWITHIGAAQCTVILACVLLYSWISIDDMDLPWNNLSSAPRWPGQMSSSDWSQSWPYLGDSECRKAAVSQGDHWWDGKCKKQESLNRSENNSII